MSATEDFRSVCDKLSMDLMKPFMAQKKNIYVDADLIYDYRLGALLALTNGEEQYNYVMDRLPGYLNGRSLDCARFFPDLGFTEKDLDDMIDNPEYFIFLTAASPASTFLDDLDMIIKIINTLNQSKEVTEPLKITINQRKIKIHDVHKAGIIARIHSIDPRVLVDFTEFPSWYKINEKFLEEQDFICVYDMIEFLHEGAVSQKLLSSVPSKLMHADILTLFQSDKQLPTDDDFKNLKTIMECMCDKFSFIPRTLRKEGIINGG